MIAKPFSLALCFIGSDPDLVESQISNFRGLQKFYDLEIWKRHSKFSGNYHSFSQIINEAICDTNSEFMFFINPKVSGANESDILDMLEELNSGYCWTSRIAFGFFGATKELFRKTGLMDERFIGSEYEDDDFSLRLKILGKAIIWKYDYSRYQEGSKGSALSELRGCSASVFEQKWNPHEHQKDLYFLDSSMSEEKKLPSRILNNPRKDISDSWKDYRFSIIQEDSHVGMRGKEAVIFFDDRPKLHVKSRGKIIIEASEGFCKVEFQCDLSTKIFIVLVHAQHKKEHTVSSRRSLKSNHWHTDYLEKVDCIEIKIFHEGEKIFHDRSFHIPGKLDLEIGLKISKKDGELFHYRRITQSPKIKLIHLLLAENEPEDIPLDFWKSRMDKQKNSFNVFSALKDQIEYLPLFSKVNRTLLPSENCADPEIIDDSKDLKNDPPVLSYGHYGAYLAHKTAILNHFDDDYDAILIVEGDVVFDCSGQEFIEWIHKAVDFSLLNNGSFVTFGKVSFGSSSQASIQDTTISMGDFNKIDHFLCAHCYMILRREKESIQNKLISTGWHAWDIWLYWNYDRRVPIFSSKIPLVRETEGFSLIDYKTKETFL